MGESSVAQNLSKPKLTNGVWSSAMSFSKCHAELKVPVDPHAPNVFDGDEFNRAVRFWTYGYDVYTPNRVVIAHDYQRENPRALEWRKDDSASWNSVLNKSHARLRTIAGMPGGEENESKALRFQKSKFGLGDRRSLEQFVAFSGIDTAISEFPFDGKSRCGNLQWISFPEHPKGAEYIPRFDDRSEDPVDSPDTTSVWYEDKGAGPDRENVQYKDPLANLEDFKEYHVESPEKRIGIGKIEKEAKAKDVIKDEKDHGRSKQGASVSHATPTVTMLRSDHNQPHDSSSRPGKQVPSVLGPGKHLRHSKSKASKAGLHKLPPLVQVSVVFLVLGVALSIFIQKGTGVGRKKYLARKKRAL